MMQLMAVENESNGSAKLYWLAVDRDPLEVKQQVRLNRIAQLHRARLAKNPRGFFLAHDVRQPHCLVHKYRVATRASDATSISDEASTMAGQKNYSAFSKVDGIVPPILNIY